MDDGWMDRRTSRLVGGADGWMMDWLVEWSLTDGQEVADSRQFIVHLFQHSLAQLVTSGALCNRRGDRGTEQARRVSRPTQPRLPCVSLTRLCLHRGQGLGARGRGLGLLPQAPGLAPRHSAAASPVLPGAEASPPAWLRPGASPLPAPARTWRCWRLSLCAALSLDTGGTCRGVHAG